MELTLIAQQARELVNAETAIVALAEAGGKRVYYAAGVGKHADAIVGKRNDSQASGLCGVAFAGTDPVLVCQTQNDDRVRQDMAIAFNITTALAVPLYHQGHLQGALMVLNRNDGTPFDAESEQLLADYAPKAAERIARQITRSSD